MNPLQVYIHSMRQGVVPRLSDAQLDWISTRYPFFVLPFATEAAAEKDDLLRRHRLMAHVAPAAADRTMLLSLVDPAGLDIAGFYPDEQPSTPTTESAIDTFLDTYGHRDPKEEAILERLIFNPVADYSAILEKEAAESHTPVATAADEQSQRLASFLASMGEVVPEPAAEPESTAHVAAPDPDSSLSESLAKIYISRQRYEKAYEIINQLSLNNPKKSVYFADQLRFLRKLIHNQRLIDSRKTANNSK